MSLNISTAPVFFRQGACLPKQCTEGMYINFSQRATSFLTQVFQKVIKRFGITYYVFPEDLGVQVSFTNPAVSMGQKSVYLE